MADRTPTSADGTTSPGLPQWMRLLGFAAVAGGLWWGLGRMQPRRPPVPLKTAYWYWHQPFRLDAEERRQLAGAKVERLYVLAATVVRRGEGLALVSNQDWTENVPVPVVGVFRVENRALDQLLAPGGGERAAELIRKAGLPESLIGVQWDADVPTARLPDYRQFLQAARKGIPENRLLSVTALPDWMHSPDYASLCSAVDEIAPQFYGNSWPREGREPPSLWEADRLVEQVRRAAAGGARVWVGLPAYGRCLVADAKGRFGGVRHDLDPNALLEDPVWEVGHASTRETTFAEQVTSIPYEDALLLRSREETLAGSALFPPGTSFWFQWPRVEGLRSAAGALSKAAIPGVEGVSLFRWPIREEPLALAPVGLDGNTEAPAVALSLRLERQGARIAVVVRNEGVDSPRLAGGVRVEVTPGGGEVVPQSEAAGFQGEERSSLLRADRVRFDRPLLRPGTEWTPCEVESPKGTVLAELHWTDAQGPRLAVARLNVQGVGKGDATDAPR